MQLELWSIVKKGTEFKKNYNLHQQVRFQAIFFCPTPSLIKTSYIYSVTLRQLSQRMIVGELFWRQ